MITLHIKIDENEGIKTSFTRRGKTTPTEAFLAKNIQSVTMLMVKDPKFLTDDQKLRLEQIIKAEMKTTP